MIDAMKSKQNGRLWDSARSLQVALEVQGALHGEGDYEGLDGSAIGFCWIFLGLVVEVTSVSGVVMVCARSLNSLPLPGFTMRPRIS